MQITDLEELHYIAPIDNLKSICNNGILSHENAEGVKHSSVAMEEIQEIRAQRSVPQGLLLHQYVNLYINARNKMLFKRKDLHERLCVIRVDKDVLMEQSVVIADRNASSDYVFFRASPAGLANIEKNRVFAKYWNHPDDLTDTWLHGSQICAEVLVPYKVDPKFILGVYVSGDAAENLVASLNLNLDIKVVPDLFFQ